MSITLAKALRTQSSPCVAFIGAGGKTTAMFQLARQLPTPVIVTATSHLGVWQIPFADKHLITDTPTALEDIEHRLQGVILVTGSMDGERTRPINNNLLDWLRQFCGYHSIPLIIEADGARQKPLKAWAEQEPPIPSFVEQVLQVVGLSGLGKILNHESVHRPELFSRLSGLQIGEDITPDSCAGTPGRWAQKYTCGCTQGCITKSGGNTRITSICPWNGTTTTFYLSLGRYFQSKSRKNVCRA